MHNILYMCCYESVRLYLLTVNNAIIKEGGDFGLLEKFRFNIWTCVTDKEYEDNDPTTNDMCIRNISACIHTDKTYEKYGLTIEVNVTTDT